MEENTELKYTVNEADLKDKGYTFQKLYANNYKCYHKKINYHTIWLWVAGKTIEVNDWYGWTKNIITFYLNNYDNPLFDEIGFYNEPKNYIKVQLNPETGMVQLYDYEEYFKVFKTSDWTVWEEKYGSWHNEIILKRDKMDELIKEIEYLTK